MTSAALCGSGLLYGYQEEGECLQPKQIHNVEREQERKQERAKVISKEGENVTLLLCALSCALE